jgi:hypothetical protein
MTDGLITPWQKGGFYANEETAPGMAPDTDLSGDLAVKRGTDPLFTDGQQETPNSVSGLPLRPARLVSEEEPPGIPSLEDRRPGTIDKR